MKKYTTETFIIKANEIHNNYYDYSKSIYIGTDTKCIIVCKIHGEFKQSPYSHINKKQGCKYCSSIKLGVSKRKTKEQFIKDAINVHGELYDYSKVIYQNTNTNVIIICNKHGDFLQRPSAHINQYAGCKKCADEKFAKDRTFTTEIFIKRAKEKHCDIYDYSLVNYKSSQENIIIKCKKHGEFLQKPNNHLQGDGCRKCGSEKIGNLTRKTTEQFIEEAIKIHGDKYIYDKVIYETTHTKVIIICKKHNEFLQCPSEHLIGRGCPECGKISAHDKQRFTKEIFIEKANKKHNNQYDYSKVEYIDSQTKVIIICKIHGEFPQQANSHIQGYGCNLCAIKKNSDNQRFTPEQIIKKAIEIHGDLYDYSDINYVNYSSTIKIKCNIDDHGIFEQLPGNHIRFKQGCPKCSGRFMNTELFIEKAKEIHNDKYNYNKVKYIKSDIQIIITCKEHGDFKQTPNNHLSGSDCNKCFKKYSKPQIEWLNNLQSALNITIENGDNIGEHRIKNSRYHADGYNEDYNLIFEFHGCFYHGCKKCFKCEDNNDLLKKTYQELYNNTQKKKEHCIKEGYKYIQIWGCEWTNIKNSNELLQNYIDDLINNNNFLQVNDDSNLSETNQNIINNKSD